MDPQVETQEKPRADYLQLLMDRVEKASNIRSEETVTFIKGEVVKPEEKLANAIFDNLLLTLKDITEESVIRVEKKDPRATEYLFVAQGISMLAPVVRAVADDQLPLRRNWEYERELRQAGDSINLYGAKDVVLDGVTYKWIDVRVRPTRYDALFTTSQNSPRGGTRKTNEAAQPRMTIRAIPKDYPWGEVTIRIDEDGPQDNKEIQYDVVVGSSDDNLMDRGLEFPLAYQKSDHHFESTYTSKDLQESNTSFTSILNAYNSKIDAHVRRISPRATNPLPPLPSKPQGS